MSPVLEGMKAADHKSPVIVGASIKTTWVRSWPGLRSTSRGVRHPSMTCVAFNRLNRGLLRRQRKKRVLPFGDTLKASLYLILVLILVCVPALGNLGE